MNPEPLNYGDSSTLPWHRRRRVRRGLLLVVLAALATAAWLVGPQLWRHARFLYLQASTANAPLAPQQLMLQIPATQPIPPNPAIALAVKNFTDSWRATQSVSPTSIAGTPLFIRRLVTPKGQERTVLVLADVSPAGELVLTAWSYDVRGLTPGGGFKGELFKHLDVSHVVIGLWPGQTLSVYGGDIDPNDASRVKVRYQLNGVDHQFSAWLTDGTAPRESAQLQWDPTTPLFNQNPFGGGLHFRGGR